MHTPIGYITRGGRERSNESSSASVALLKLRHVRYGTYDKKEFVAWRTWRIPFALLATCTCTILYRFKFLSYSNACLLRAQILTSSRDKLLRRTTAITAVTRLDSAPLDDATGTHEVSVMSAHTDFHRLFLHLLVATVARLVPFVSSRRADTPTAAY